MIFEAAAPWGGPSRACGPGFLKLFNTTSKLMADKIARAIALPGMAAPLRFPSFPALERTAVMSFNAAIPYTLAEPGVNHVMLTRSATFPLWGEVRNPLLGTSTFWGASYEMTVNDATVGGTTWNSSVVDTSAVFWTGGGSGVARPTFTGSTSPIVTRAVIGQDAGLTDVPFVYVPGQSHLTISMAAIGVAFDATVTVEAWTAPGDLTSVSSSSFTFTSVGATSAGAAYPIATNSWFRVKAVALEVGGGAARFAPVVYLGCCCSHTAPVYTPNATFGSWAASATDPSYSYLLPLTLSPEYANSIIPWQATRLNAVAALFTNTTKVLNKEGTALWGRLSPCAVSPWRTVVTDIDQLHPAEKRFMGLENGCYAYNPPSTDLGDFKNYTYRSFYSFGNNPTDSHPVYRLDSTAYVCHGFLTDPDGGTNLAINLDYHLEFRNSSTLFQIGVANQPLEALHTAQLALLKAGFFFQNEDHGGAIGKIISVLSQMHPLLRVVAPIASGILGSSYIAANKRQPMVQATSGQRSGMVSKKKTTKKKQISFKKKSKPKGKTVPNDPRRVASQQLSLSARLPPYK